VPPDYDDDDIVEDYQEVSTDSARRVQSAQGGPVQRPAGRADAAGQRGDMPGDMPEEETYQKGKITKSSAKLIWIICIAITVLGVAAVLVDMLWDPLGRKSVAGGSTNASSNDGGGGGRRNSPPREDLSPEQKLQREFLSAVIARMKEMDASKAWDFYWVSYLEFDDAYDKAATLKKKEGVDPVELEEAWAIAIKHYYKARYAGELFKYRFDEDYISKEYMPISLSGDEVTFLDAETLRDNKARTYQAAYSKIDAKSTSINLFKTDILKSELTAQKVYESQEWSDKHFGHYKTLWDAATGERKFPQEDVDFVNQPDYKAGEKKMFEDYLAKKGG
jgi:hypothetical protein